MCEKLSGWACGSLSSADNTVLHLSCNRKVNVIIRIVSATGEQSSIASELHWRYFLWLTGFWGGTVNKLPQGSQCIRRQTVADTVWILQLGSWWLYCCAFDFAFITLCTSAQRFLEEEWLEFEKVLIWNNGEQNQVQKRGRKDQWSLSSTQHDLCLEICQGSCEWAFHRLTLTGLDEVTGFLKYLR